MIVQCEQCMAKYRIDESRIPGEKAKVKCSRCQHVFLVSKDNTPYEEPTMLLSLQEGPEEPFRGSSQESFQESFQQPFQASFQCPNCGFQQPHSEECMKCGIIFSKFKPRVEMTPPPSPYSEGGFGLDENLIDNQAEVRSMTYAGFLRRFVAYLIDGVVVGTIALIILMVTVGPTWLAMLSYFSQNHMTANPQLGAFPASFPLALFMGVSLSTVLPVLYFIIMWGRKGATLGKMAMGIRIVRTDGSDISYGTAFLRYIGYQVVSPALFFLGFLWMLWDDREQTWHDKIASTCVIRT